MCGGGRELGQKNREKRRERERERERKVNVRWP
jgi:hypothetical protein